MAVKSQAREDEPAPTEPRWLRVLALAASAAVAAFGTVGLLFADLGIYRPLYVFPPGTVIWGGLLVLGWPLISVRGRATRMSHLVAALAVVFIAGVSVWNAANHSQHVLIDRDPGSYANTGRWIASHGDLTVDARVPPFTHEPKLVFSSQAVDDRDHTRLTFQFSHLLPAVLAEAQGIGGDRLMFAMPALLAGVGLLALFVAAWRLVGNPYAALGALVAFAFLLPEVWFSRDTYSELPAQVLLFTALWILLDRGTFFRPRVVFVAALFLGALQSVRIDALAFLLGIPLLFAVVFVSTNRSQQGVVARSVGACAFGLAPGMVLGLCDLVFRSPQYFADRYSDVTQLVRASIASIVVSIMIVLVVPAFRSRFGSRESWRRLHVADVAALVVLLVGFGAWIVRPRIQHVAIASSRLVQVLQEAAHVGVDPTRSYFERSMVWMSWYLGPVALAAAIVGAALLTRSLLRGGDRGAVALFALLAPAAVLYIWNASVSPDQIWAMRRYLVAALPLFVLLTFWLAAYLVRTAAITTGAVRVGLRAIALIIAAFAIAVPVSSVAHLRRIADQRGFLAAVRDACGVLPGDADVVVLASTTNAAHLVVPQTLRSWCDAPVAILDGTAASQRAELEHLRQKALALGHPLWVVAGNAETITAAFPQVTPIMTRTVANPFSLEPTIVRRPSHYLPQTFALALARVPAR